MSRDFPRGASTGSQGPGPHCRLGGGARVDTGATTPKAWELRELGRAHAVSACPKCYSMLWDTANEKKVSPTHARWVVDELIRFSSALAVGCPSAGFRIRVCANPISHDGECLDDA